MTLFVTPKVAVSGALLDPYCTGARNEEEPAGITAAKAPGYVDELLLVKLTSTSPLASTAMDGLNAAAPPGPVMLPCATRLLLEVSIFTQCAAGCVDPGGITSKTA